MGLVQRTIEAAGIPTVSVTMLPEITRRVGVPRAILARHPLGHPFGMPGEAFLRKRILRLMLACARDLREPGTIVDPGLGDGSGPPCRACGP